MDDFKVQTETTSHFEAILEDASLFQRKPTSTACNR